MRKYGKCDLNEKPDLLVEVRYNNGIARQRTASRFDKYNRIGSLIRNLTDPLKLNYSLSGMERHGTAKNRSLSREQLDKCKVRWDRRFSKRVTSLRSGKVKT